MIFPVGNITGVFFSEEIKFALELGCTLIDVYSALEFEGQPIFTKFVDHFFKKKQESSGFEKHLYKLILNSLSGRFGINKKIQNLIQTDKNTLNSYLICTKNVDILKQTGDVVTLRYDYEKDSLTEKILVQWGDCGKKHLALIKKFDYRIANMNSCVAISAAITAYSRVKMMQDIFYLKNYCNIYYIDTDSLVIDKPLPDSFCGIELGKYKLEYDNCDGIFLTAKVYILKKLNTTCKFAFKGLPNNIATKLNWNWFQKIYNQDVGYEKDSKFNVKTKIKKIFKTFEIQTNIMFSYSSQFIMDKRIKIYDNQNKWVNTKAIDNDLDKTK